MATLPLLSLGIPTFRRPHRLKSLLERLTHQKDILSLEIEIVVSDNHSQDETPTVVASYQNRLPIIYSSNEQNIGSAMNFHALLTKCSGTLVWLVPADDDFTCLDSVKSVYSYLLEKPELAAMFLNHRVVELDTGKVTRQNVFNIPENIYIKDGKTIFQYLEDAHLLTGIAVIVNRKMANTDFNLRYCKTTWLSPLSMAVSACSQGPAFIVSDVLVDLGAGDPASWRKMWTHIYYQEMGELLIDCVKELGFSNTDIQKMLVKKTKRVNEVMNWKQLLFFQSNINIFRLAKLYGWKVALFWYILSPFKLLKIWLNRKIKNN